MILYSKPQKATFPMPKKSRPTAQKGQLKSREKQKRRKSNTIRRELQLKMEKSPQEKRNRPSLPLYLLLLYEQKPKSGIKKA
jgi:hypothetical protein